MTAGASLLGFEGVVGMAYPALGLLSLIFLCVPNRVSQNNYH